MNEFLIIGSGPTAVSAAFPLVNSGKKTLMLEASSNSATTKTIGFPSNQEQSGFKCSNYETLELFNRYAEDQGKTSPKIQTLAPTGFISNYKKKLNIVVDNFHPVSGFQIGGLSEFWGASCSTFQPNELDENIDYKSLTESYSEVASRIRISSDKNDALSNYLGSQYITDPPVRLSDNAHHLLEKYQNLSLPNMRLGLPRLALSTRQNSQNTHCVYCKQCFYGCKNEAIYSAKYDVRKLLEYPNFSLEMGKQIVKIWKDNDGLCVKSTNGEIFRGKKVIIAAGVISTTRLVLENFSNQHKTAPLLSNPTATFALFLPHRLNALYSQETVSLSQLAFHSPADLSSPSTFGMLYDIDSFPMIDLLRMSPLSSIGNRSILAHLMPSMMVGLAYLPAETSKNSIELNNDGTLTIKNWPSEKLNKLFKNLKTKIFKNFFPLNALLIPGSFRLLMPGAETHYAGTLSNLGLLNKNHSLKNCEDVFIADPSNLKYLPEKPHTLTSMAIANLIGKELARM